MYRIKPGVPLVIAKDRDGKVHHHYNQPIGGSILYGSCIPWLNNEQRELFLRLGLVEELGEPAATAAADDAAEGEDSRVRECVEALDRLGLPLDTGAPRAREALRDSGHRFGNDTIAAAVKARKDSRPALSRTAGD